MAEAMVRDLKLRIQYETGMNGEGKPIYKSKTYSNVAESATADQLYQAAQALASLSTYPMSSVEKNDLYEIIG